MSQTKPDALELGAAVVLLLLPQRPPFVLVDHVESFSRAARVTLRASRALSLNEPFFSTDLPLPPVLPRSLLLEGITQTAGLLQMFLAVSRDLEALGRNADELSKALRNADLGYRLEPGFAAGVGDDILDAIVSAGHTRVGTLGASQMRFLRHVFPSDTLTYEVRLVRESSDMQHFEAEVAVKGQLVGQGMLSLSKVEGLLR